MQPFSSKKQVIVNADDFGRSSTINKAIVYAFDNGIINSTTLMVNHLSEINAVQLAREHGFLDAVGLHLNLDFGVPITESIKNYDLFCDKEGRFNGGLLKDRLGRGVLKSPILKNAIQEEVASQMERFISLGCVKMHLDSHHHVHTKPFLLKVILPVASSLGFTSMRIARNMGKLSIGNVWYKKWINHSIKKSFSTTNFFGSYDDYLSADSCSGSIEIMVHPDYLLGKYVDVLSYKDEVYRDIHSIRI